MKTHLLSGLRFSTAVWVWLVVRTETCSPSGPLAVEMTSYSVGRTANSGLGVRGIHTWSEAVLLHTGGAIVWFFPVQDDEGGASFHRHHSKVGGRRTRRRSHIHVARFIFWEVVEGGGDGARLVGFLARLVDDVRRFGSSRSLISQNPSTSLGWVGSVGPPTYISLLSQSIKVRRWLWFEELRVFPGFLSTCWINKKAILRNTLDGIIPKTNAHEQSTSSRSRQDSRQVLVPAVVGANVVVCFRSCLVGLVVTRGTLGFEMGNLSFCFKLFSLSNVMKTVSWLLKKIRWDETRAGLTCFSWFPDHIRFLVERNGRASRRSWNKQTFSSLYSAAGSARCSSLRNTKMLLILKRKTLQDQRSHHHWSPTRDKAFQRFEVVNYTTQCLLSIRFRHVFARRQFLYIIRNK